MKVDREVEKLRTGEHRQATVAVKSSFINKIAMKKIKSIYNDRWIEVEKDNKTSQTNSAND